jgi:hypothetical protein
MLQYVAGDNRIEARRSELVAEVSRIKVTHNDLLTPYGGTGRSPGIHLDAYHLATSFD